MAAASMNRPTAGHPGPDGGNAHINNAPSNSGPQDPRLQSTGQEAGPSVHPQQHMSTRPVFYVPAPPPPPYLPYQWPMPFTYNPFPGLPGMGYGVVMPPFPPPPYMEAPAYILPQPHLQPVDYRRMLHPQAHPNSMRNQNPNPSRRIRPTHPAPVRETANCEVQTEHRNGRAPATGNPLITSDSGHETTSNSPSSSTSSSYKQAHVEKRSSVISNVQESSKLSRICTTSTGKRGFNMPHPTGQKTPQSCINPTSEVQKNSEVNVCRENRPTYRNFPSNIWSVSSPDDIVPVSSSCQREDEVSTERRKSVPDILMSWSGTPQATKVMQVAEKVLSSTAKHLPSYESDVAPEKSSHRPPETKHDKVVAGNINTEDDAKDVFSSDGETHEILKVPFVLRELLSESRTDNEPEELDTSRVKSKPYHDELFTSLNASHELLDKENKIGHESVVHEDTTESFIHQTSNCQLKRKMNDSVWSVESLVAYVPSKEWMMQNAVAGPEVIVELEEKAENGLSHQNGNCIVESTKDRRETHRLSSDPVPMSDSWHIFSSPADEPSAQTRCGLENDANEMRGPSKQDQNIPVDSSNEQHVKISLSTPNKHVERKGSSEPEASQSPNQESLNSPEQLERSISYEREETSSSQTTSHNGVHLESEGVVYGNEMVDQQKNEQLYVQMSHQNITGCQSKGHLVDCGIQCQWACVCENRKSLMEAKRRQPFKNTDGKRGYSSRPDDVGVTGHIQKNNKRHYQWRNKGQEKASTQPDALGEFGGKKWKMNGGNGRNPRC